MNVSAALRWTLYYRAVAWASGLLGLAFVYLGFHLSIGGAPMSMDLATDAASEPTFLGPALVGFVVWQVGKTAAYYKTLTEATDEQLGESFDPELIKSDILTVLDDRLAEMQTEVEATRRSVEEMGTSQAGGFDLDD